MNRNILLGLFIAILFGISNSSFSQDEDQKPSKFTAGLIAGYNTGYGFQANIKASDFAEEFPFELRFGFGYTFLNPGNAPDARRIFINNATNGVPEKKGGAFDYRLDFLLPKPIFGVKHSYLVFGPRYSTFKGNFKFVGGNEDFDVKSNQWGIGAGIENYFKMTEKIDLVLAFGLDYYFPGILKGHDTSYSPNNDNVNPKKDNQNDNVLFKYSNADKAINQPKIMPRAMIGISFGL
jgi:hypothetical protein